MTDKDREVFKQIQPPNSFMGCNDYFWFITGLETARAESAKDKMNDLHEAEQALIIVQQKAQIERLQRVVDAARAIADICGDDLETHFGKKYGGALRKALAATQNTKEGE